MKSSQYLTSCALPVFLLFAFVLQVAHCQSNLPPSLTLKPTERNILVSSSALPFDSKTYELAITDWASWLNEQTIETPEALGRNVLDHMKAGVYVTDDTVKQAEGAWTIYDSLRDRKTYSGAIAFLTDLLPLCYGRTAMEADVRLVLNQVYREIGEDKKRYIELTQALSLLSNVDSQAYIWRMSAILELARLDRKNGNKKLSFDEFDEVRAEYLKYRDFRPVDIYSEMGKMYVLAVEGMIDCSVGDLAALNAMQPLYPGIEQQIDPYMDDAIRASGGTPPKHGPYREVH